MRMDNIVNQFGMMIRTRILGLSLLAAGMQSIPAASRNVRERDARLHVVASRVDMQVERRGEEVKVTGSSVFQLDGYFVWCGTVLKGDKGLYYMVFSASPCGTYPFTDAWVMGSKMGVAVSARPDGDFRLLDFFYNRDGFELDSSRWDSQTASNPHLQKFGDKYYLYYAAASDPGPDRVMGNASRRTRIQQSQMIGVLSFDSFEGLLRGEFYRPESPLLAPRTRVKTNDVVDPSPPGTKPFPDNLITVNPSVVRRPSDGKYLLYFKGNIYDPTWRGLHGVAIGDTPLGPFTPLDREVFTIDSGGAKLSAEDPFVWYCPKDELFYAVFKDFTGHFTKGDPCLALMYSRNGIDWMLPENSLFMKKQLILPDGTVLKVDRLERPQLLLDKQGIPMVLYAACAVADPNSKIHGGTFNIQVGLKPEAPI